MYKIEKERERDGIQGVVGNSWRKLELFQPDLLSRFAYPLDISILKASTFLKGREGLGSFIFQVSLSIYLVGSYVVALEGIVLIWPSLLSCRDILD